MDANLFGVSAPVLDRRNRPIAVVSIWGPLTDETSDRFPEPGALTAEAATTIATAVLA